MEVLIRKVRPFEEPHAPPEVRRASFALSFAFLLCIKSRGMGVSFQKRHRLNFYGTLVRPEISALDSPEREFFSWPW